MASSSSCPILLLLLLLPLAAADFRLRSGIADSDSANCVYAIFVRTGGIFKGGTDSNISVILYNNDGDGIRIGNLETWGGLMPRGWDYFERSSLDLFSGRGPCLSSPPCEMLLISDGSGDHHGWYVNYVEVTVTGPHLGCAQALFTVERWLATDVSPYTLNATINNCSSASSRRRTELQLL